MPSKSDENQFKAALNNGFVLNNSTGTAMERADIYGSNQSFNGAIVSIDNKTGNVTGDRTRSTTASASSAFQSFNIGGKDIIVLGRPTESGPIKLRDINANDFPNNDGGNGVGAVGSLAYGSVSDSPGKFTRMRFGMYTTEDGVTHMFVHGNPSGLGRWNIRPDYTYVGHAIHRDANGVTHQLPDSVEAKVSAASDRVDIKIALPSETLNFGGAITGNTFKGTENGITTSGGFFGNYDVGGIYRVNSGSQQGSYGVFGATEQ